MIELVAVLAALVIAILGLIWAVKVIKETLITGLLVIVIFVLLYIAFQITPREVYAAFQQLPELMLDLLQSFRSGEN